MKATGRQRHRSHKLFGGKHVCVLQFEYEYMRSSYASGRIDTEYHTGWFDARPEQLTIEGESPYVESQTSSPTVGSSS